MNGQATTLAAAIAELDLAEVVVALHTADPGDGDMATNEVSYAGYMRVNVALPLGASIDFPRGTGGAGKATYYSVGAVGGSTEIFFAGPLLVSIPIGDGLTPHLWTER